LYICGHSLGGALANLCFSYFVLSDRPRPVAAVYTVGQPRAGNKKFKEQLELAAPNTPFIRITNNQDCVPSLAGGQHCGIHLHITATGYFTFVSRNYGYIIT
jgi:triacylglycerol lipase